MSSSDEKWPIYTIHFTVQYKQCSKLEFNLLFPIIYTETIIETMLFFETLKGMSG